MSVVVLGGSGYIGEAFVRALRERNQPFRQDGEGLPAWMADPAADPNALVSVIIRLPESPAVADDRLAMAKRA